MAVKRYFGTDDLTVTPTISTGIYADGDNIGGLMQFEVKEHNSGGLVHSIFVVDDDKQAAALDFYIFRDLPSATFTDNVAFPALGSADAQLLRGIVSLAAGGYSDLTTVSWGRVKANDAQVGESLSLRTPGGIIYIAMRVNVSTPTFTATNKLHIGVVSYMD
jgi:hypothetical protein